MAAVAEQPNLPSQRVRQAVSAAAGAPLSPAAAGGGAAGGERHGSWWGDGRG